MRKSNKSKKNLALPILSQAKLVNGQMQLDIASITTGQVEVIVPRSAQRDIGDKIVVSVKGQQEVHRYFYVATMQSTGAQGDSVYFQPLEIFQNGNFNVSYKVTDRSDNTSVSDPQPITIINAESNTMSNIVYHQNCFYGQHNTGVVDSWLVPTDYTLTENDIGLIRALDTGMPNGTTLEVRRLKGEDQYDQVVQMEYDGTDWHFSATWDDSLTLAKGDNLTLNLISDTQFLAFELTI